MTDEAHKVAERADGRIRPLPGRFDALGTALLAEARRHPEGLILDGGDPPGRRLLRADPRRAAGGVCRSCAEAVSPDYDCQTGRNPV